MESRLIIVGIDPGTTMGYAVLDLDGNVVALKSSKNMGLNVLIEEVLKEGKAILVGTDKAKVPNLVNLFSAKTGAKIFNPREDLRVEEKRELTKNFDAKNGHQSDALASSLFAYNRIKGTIGRIENYAKENNKLGLKNRIVDLVITKEISIREAIDIIENDSKEEIKIIKNVVEKKELRQRDFLNLYRMMKRHEKESYLLKKQNLNLKEYINLLEAKNSNLQNIEPSNADKRMEKKLIFKDKNIDFLQKRVGDKERKIQMLEFEVSEFEKLLANISHYRILKVLDNLGRAEFNKKALGINNGDILFVRNPNIVSDEVMQTIESKVEIIISKEPVSRKVKEKYNITFLEGKDKVKEYGNFAAVLTEEMDSALQGKTLLRSVIESYKQKRREEIISSNP